MRERFLISFAAAIPCALFVLTLAVHAAEDRSAYAAWPNGPSADPHYFPIAVWVQQPANAERYKKAGINLYVGLWRGPTSNQLALLQRAGMRVICTQNSFALANKDNPTIAAWMHGDEPDNAQSLGSGKGYGPPIKPETIVERYARMRADDPTRPVLLNLGQGVAWDNYIGRGVRRNHPEDYSEYVKGCDIASFDIYPAVHDQPEVAGKLEFVAKGVERLRRWTPAEKIVWNCIECTHISNADVKPTPHQMRAEVWMSLIHGSKGLIYFVHQFKPTFKEAALLDDPEMLKAVTAINHQIRELAPALNSSTVTNVLAVTSSTPVATMVKRHGEHLYIFAVEMSNQPAHFGFKIAEQIKNTNVEVLGSSRTIFLRNGEFSDDFKPYDVNLYRIRAVP
jgi:hypothetical protein